MATTNLPPSLESLAKTVRAMLAKREEELQEQRREAEGHRKEDRPRLEPLDQHDERFEERRRQLDEHGRRHDEQMAEIRRILDRLERRLADDGGRPAA